jgi:hypothetical protein
MPSIGVVPLHAVAKYIDEIAPNTYAAAARTGNEINASGFERAAFQVLVGTCKHSGATIAYSIYQTTKASGTYTLMTGSLDTVTAPTDANKVHILDVKIDPSYPYIKMYSTSATAWTNYGVTVILYGGSGPMLRSSETTPSVV